MIPSEAGSFLREVRSRLETSSALARKRVVGDVAHALSGGPMPLGWPTAIGDDAAPIPHGEEFLLLAADGVAAGLFADPEWAGYCSVLVNVNDIAAMGGRPLALVNVLSGADEGRRTDMLRGIARACGHFGVPMVGGHLHPEETREGLAVAIVGTARRPLSSFDARPGQRVVLAVDLLGSWHEPFSHWDSTSARPADVVRRHLGVLPELAEAGCVASGKDVSNPGILGTLLMLLETSGVGAHVDLDEIPRPPGVDLLRWLECYPGFGFLLTVEPDREGEVIGAFRAADVAARAIGEVVAGSRLTAESCGAECELWDISERPVTGVLPSTSGGSST